jgi:hypothetical protein
MRSDVAKDLITTLKVLEHDLQEAFSAVNPEEVFYDLLREAGGISNQLKIPSPLSHKGLSLIMLSLFRSKLVHKDDIARVGSDFLGETPTDWQARHLSSQCGFNILNKNDVIPGTNLKCPSGWHMLVNLTELSPKYSAIKRPDCRLDMDFKDLKKSHGNRCGHCGSKEGKANFRDGTLTALQQGHINPSKPLEAGNIMPLCDYCNRTYKDDYVLLANGAIERSYIESERVAQGLVDAVRKCHGMERTLTWLTAK